MNTLLYIGTKQLASILGLSSRTVEKWRTTGEGPAFLKLGRRVVYDKKDVDLWLENNRHYSTSDQGREYDNIKL